MKCILLLLLFFIQIEHEEVDQIKDDKIKNKQPTTFGRNRALSNLM